MVKRTQATTKKAGRRPLGRQLSPSLLLLLVPQGQDKLPPCRGGVVFLEVEVCWPR